MDKKTSLTRKIKSLGFPDKEIVVTLDDFFEGNSDPGSIGPNIYPDQPLPKEFYKKLSDLKGSDKVVDVLVRISDVEDLDWPYTDTIYIITNLTSEELKVILKDLYPDEIYDDWMYGKPVNAPTIEEGMKVYSVWWD
jgi:hypothetical protein